MVSQVTILGSRSVVRTLLYPARKGQHRLLPPRDSVSQVSWSHLRDSLVTIFTGTCRGSPRCSQAVSLEGQHGGYARGSQKAALRKDQSGTGQHCFPVLPFIWLSGSYAVNYSRFEPTFKLFDKYLMKYTCAKTVCIFITKVCFFFAGVDGVIPAQVS